jgi:signal transduction histidine kinase
MPMTAAELFRRIRPNLTARTASALMGASGVRVSLTVPLERLFDLLEGAIASGDPSHLDPVLAHWSTARRESDLSEGGSGAPTLFALLAQVSLTIAHERLAADEAVAVTGALLPVLFYCEQKAGALEYERDIQHITGELQEISRRLERLDQTKSNFISVAGHELRTPLTLIEGYSTMLSELLAEGDGQTQTLIGGIHTGVQRLKEIVDDMIDVSLIDSNLLALKCQPLRLKQLLRSLSREFASIAAQRRLDIQIQRFPGSDRLILADPERLQQSFRNLLANAVKYTPDGGRITIDGHNLPGFVEVVIADTGIGIDPQDQVSIFEKFEQIGQVSLHSSGKTKFKGGGPGLGLAITRGIIRAHGGEIWVESAGYDEVKCPGTTFHVLLPHRAQAVDPRLARLFGQEVLATIQ